METAQPVSFSSVRIAVIAAAEAEGQQKITPRCATSTHEELATWTRSRHAGAVVGERHDYARALEAYATELGVDLFW